MKPDKLEQDFFARPTRTIARELLGQRLVREIEGQRLSGTIVETEAYIGPTDTANHASKGRTARTEVMFGPPGRTYVYLIYGIYYMLNITTGQEGFPAAVLIRAIEPQEGIEIMRAHRQKANRPPVKVAHLTNGPGKLCQALRVDKTLHNWELSMGRKLWLEAAPPVAGADVAAGPRIGIDYADPQDRTAPWRFWIAGNRFVSKM